MDDILLILSNARLESLVNKTSAGNRSSHATQHQSRRSSQAATWMGEQELAAFHQNGHENLPSAVTGARLRGDSFAHTRRGRAADPHTHETTRQTYRRGSTLW